MALPYLTLSETCDVVIRHIEHEFSNLIASLYYGDILIYPPNTFRDRLNEWAPVIAVSPAYNRLVDEHSTMNSEVRNYGIEILCLVNYTPYISVPPEEAMGERMLNEIAEKVRAYFAMPGNLSFDYAIQNAKVMDIDFGWTPQLNQPIKGASIMYQVTTRVPRT